MDMSSSSPFDFPIGQCIHYSWVERAVGADIMLKQIFGKRETEKEIEIEMNESIHLNWCADSMSIKSETNKRICFLAFLEVDAQLSAG